MNENNKFEEEHTTFEGKDVILNESSQLRAKSFLLQVGRIGSAEARGENPASFLPAQFSTQNYAYKRILACVRCETPKFFRSEEQLQQHFERKHVDKEIAFETVVIDGRYIAQRLETCKTEEISIACTNPECENSKQSVLHFENSCCIRICGSCYKTRKNRNILKYEKFIDTFKRKIFLTLTLKGHHADLKAAKDEINYAWKKFFQQLQRKHSYSYKFVKAFEFVAYDDGNYVHLHLVIDMPFVEQQEISDLWEKATEGSKIVDVRAVKEKEGRTSTQNAIHYITKYISKPFERNVDEKETITKKEFYDEYALKLYGKHFYQSFTSLVNRAVREQKIPRICEKCGCKLQFLESISIAARIDNNTIAKLCDFIV